MGHAVRASEAGQTAVDAMFRQAGVIQVDTLDEMFDVAQLLAHQPLPRGNRVAIVGNSDALALIAADAAVAAGLEVQTVGGLRPGRQRGGVRAGPRRGDRRPRGRRGARGLHPARSNTTGAEVANVLAVVGEQSDKPVVSTFLAAEGIPELLRVPDVAGSTAGRGSVPSYGSPDAGGARAGPRRGVRRLAGPSRAGDRGAGRGRPGAGPGRGQPGARAADPRAATSTTRSSTELLGAYGVELWQRVPVDSADSAVRPPAKLGWDVVLKATADHLRHRPDLAHVWRNIDTEEEMRDAWQTMHGAHRVPGDGRLRGPAASRLPGCRSRIHGAGGPAVRAGAVRSASPGPSASCSATAPTASRR